MSGPRVLTPDEFNRVLNELSSYIRDTQRYDIEDRNCCPSCGEKVVDEALHAQVCSYLQGDVLDGDYGNGTPV